MRNDRVTTSQYCISEGSGDDGPLMKAGAEDRVALAALDLELQLVALDLGDARSHDDGAAGGGRREMPHMDFIPDRCVAFGRKAFYAPRSGHFMVAVNGRVGKRTFAPAVMARQVPFNNSSRLPPKPGWLPFK